MSIIFCNFAHKVYEMSKPYFKVAKFVEKERLLL